MKSTTRNYGIDILRIIAMLGVVFLHVLGFGGILDSVESAADYSMAWFFEILAYPAVNCFVLISGYVGYRGEKHYPKLKNLISLHFIVLFYSIVICMIFKLCGLASVENTDILGAFMPMTSKQYWFFSAYFGMFLLSPFLNMIVHKATKKQSIIFFIFVLVISVCSIIYDPFLLGKGYGMCWLVLLYCIGAVIKKYDLSSVLSAGKWALIGFGSFIPTWGIKILVRYMRESFLKTILESTLAYVFPLMLLAAIGWVCAFSRMKCNKVNPKLISFFSTSAFSVYLIHENPYIRNSIVKKIHNYAIDDNTFTLALSIICAALIIFIVCILIDKVRILLFRLARVDKLSEKIEDITKKVVDMIYRKFDSLTQ